MPPVVYFFGAGQVSALERASYDPDVRVFFTKKAYLCREANDEWTKIWKEFKQETSPGVPVLLTLDSHASQTRRGWQKEMQQADTQILHTEPGGTHVCQMIDRHVGRLHKHLFQEEQMEYLLENFDQFGHLSARDRRIYATHWVGAVWRKYVGQKRREHYNCCLCSGLLIRLDAVHDEKITVESNPLFAVQGKKSITRRNGILLRNFLGFRVEGSGLRIGNAIPARRP